MTRGELKHALRQQRRALQRQLRLQRAERRKQLERSPAYRQKRRERRLRRTLLVALLLLLLSMLRCSCIVPPLLIGSGPPPPAPVVVQAPPPLTGNLSKGRRGRYQGTASTPPPWLTDFRLQVSARSPRLAACFRGATKPGALRWTSAINPETGTVSDHDLEPLGGTATMTEDKRQCLITALSAPNYKLKAPPTSASTPIRVGIVIEF